MLIILCIYIFEIAVFARNVKGTEKRYLTKQLDRIRTL